MNHPLIEFVNVSKSFGNQNVLSDVNLKIETGKITAIIGKSGVGKSILLKHIVGLIWADSGQVLFEGQSLAHMSRKQKKTIRHKLSYMFQGGALFDSLTVYENIALPLAEHGRLSHSEINQRVSQQLHQLDLDQVDEKYPSQLSGGMKKRVALARALITRPQIVLFDEPTTGLDPVRKEAVHQLIADHQRQFKFTAIIVSHEIPDIFSIAQDIAMLDAGQIIFQGSPADIERSDIAAVKQFLHIMRIRQQQICANFQIEQDTP